MRHDAALPADEREKLGAHYTPMAWARRIVERALHPLLHPLGVACPACAPSDAILDLLVVDPACGDGVFLDAAADVLGALLFFAYQAEGRDVSLAEARRDVLAECILGVDIDAGAVAASRARLGDAAELICADSLLDWSLDTAGRSTAFVGNPPFLGGMRISSVLGSKYAKELRKQYPYSKGNADLSSYFLMRSANSLDSTGSRGTVGMVFTNTIAQGDTREAALGPLLQEHGYWIYAADKHVKWPGDANVSVSIVHLANKRLAWLHWPEAMLERAIDFPFCWLDDPLPEERLVSLIRPNRSRPRPMQQEALFA